MLIRLCQKCANYFTVFCSKNVMSMPDEDSKKMEEIRKFSAIYGRFDAKRKPEKPLTLHEVSYSSEKKTKSYLTN